jgi:peroxiredoxin
MTIDQHVFEMMRTNTDKTVWELSHKNPTMLVFLRHFGCQFCRETMDEIAQRRQKIEEEGGKVVVVHMAEYEVATEYLERYNLNNVENISDVNCNFYEAFGLGKGSFRQLFGLKNFIRGFSLQQKYGNSIGKELGDSRQMPGIFIVSDGKIIERYVHAHAGDRPDYDKLISCVFSPPPPV